ncbi:hypothetical protein BDP81DRAFT_439571 [Colletotrichum phormii]|uniref:Secreted protein n=1 Tax=Colletotrichum phormii TaxID=359342 RepID=A0AAI9ZH21_9PEZI|nr:uncharacterized protein BDP81DRAFT_439571 [Colletotrichum phormii]KAK1623440.1 hypothetical protein BDP81DRAFT_439571 [Colletotrichum phormii]
MIFFLPLIFALSCLDSSRIPDHPLHRSLMISTGGVYFEVISKHKVLNCSVRCDFGRGKPGNRSIDPSNHAIYESGSAPRTKSRTDRRESLMPDDCTRHSVCKTMATKGYTRPLF